ncbi:PREDICTED: uncharacterized protein LOC106816841 [Priapulus caudatus]|uniref:Uncharacterized protein LOC106816841 n=1 Tax=Priapulus caudatus TaxID=37621 RepID=A0ABM1EXP1_PRICU|nr:PREDICTED: uncharacterized protein LOC106816841 [Priapulus caudatus]
MPGHNFSFREEQELKLIKKAEAYASLRACERSLAKDPLWKETYMAKWMIWFQRAPFETTPTPLSWAVQKNNTIYPWLDLQLRTIIETGLLQKWGAQVLQNRFAACSEPDAASVASRQISLRQMLPVFVMLFAGVAAGLLLLLAEIVGKQLKHRRAQTNVSSLPKAW